MAALGWLGMGCLLLGAPAVIGLARSARAARAGGDALNRAVVSLEQGSATDARADLDRARAAFSSARDDLRGPLTSLGLGVPGVADNLRAARTLVAVGAEVADNGTRLVGAGGHEVFRLQEGSVPVDQLARLSPVLADTREALTRSRARVDAIRRFDLLPPLRRGVQQLSLKLAAKTPAVERAADLASGLPAIVGVDGPRRYFLAFQNNTELRGSGGIIGNWGELVARDGRFTLERFGRLAELDEGGNRPRALDLPEGLLRRWPGFDVAGSWSEANVSPDFPTSASVIAQRYPQSDGRPIDGVIAVDIPGLAALLELAGPVNVEGWPVPVTAENVIDLVARGAYERFTEGQERVDFLGRVAERTWLALSTTSGASARQLAHTFGGAVRGRHVQVAMQREGEQRLVASLGADGELPPVRGDSLMLVNQNVSANKLDLYLRRRMRYVARLAPSGSAATLVGRLEVTLQNDAPSSGLSPDVIGPFDARFAPGENRTYLSVYTPLQTTAAGLDEQPVVVDGQEEFGRRVYSIGMIIPSGRSRTVALALAGEVRLAPDGWYHLDLLHQASFEGDDVDVELAVPADWRIVEARGLRVEGGRQAHAHLRLSSETTLSVRLEPA